ncbi:MBL fold metallo-hydrolase [Mucilaginibacter sp.]|nr:MBL fold metallo-hydrolase [Mucilaginibacter sp.]
MEITFHGAARNVTGSKHLLRLNDGTTVLLDCGMFQGLGEQTDGMNEHFGFNPKKIDYLILSHAHIDHCGLIPRLVKEGFEGTIFCTSATMDLARILMMDSARIQMQDVEYTNKQRAKHGQSLLEALYNEDDAMAAMRLFKIVDYHQEYAISQRLRFKFTDAGHILGSAAVHITVFEDAKETHITFSGDVGRYGDLI